MTKHWLTLWLAATAALCAVPARAHDVQAVVSQGPPRQVTLSYGDGEPFAYEAYELRAPGAPLADAPVQAGRTSDAGVITLDTAPPTALRLRAFSADGHGVDMVLPAVAASTAVATARTTAITPAATPGERIVRALAGLLAIGALYALWLAVQRRRRARAAQASD